MKKRIDKTSAVMLVIFLLIIIGAVAGAVLLSVLGKEDDTYEQSQDVQMQDSETAQGYETCEELAGEFERICALGDVDALYDLYYEDYLDKMRENAAQEIDKAYFDENIAYEMLSVSGTRIYRYGDVDMPATQSPAVYAGYIYARTNNGKQLPIEEDMIEDCANLLVYAGGRETNHFMVEIDGFWYFIV